MPRKPTGRPAGRPRKDQSAPSPVAQTGNQFHGTGGGQTVASTLLGGYGGDWIGWGSSKGSIAIYRRMAKNATLAIARIASQAPVRRLMSRATFVKQGTGTDEMKKTVEDAMTPDLRRLLVKQCASFGVDYGCQAFEIVWGVSEETGMQVPVDFKPLLPEITTPVVGKGTGEIIAVKNKNTEGEQTELEGGDFFWFVFDTEARNPFGCPRMEACRPIWNAWNLAFERIGKWTNKVSAVIPMVEYPTGVSRDEMGRQDINNYDIANALLARLGQGHGVAMPNTLAAWAEELAAKGIDTGKIPAWKITFLEAATGHGAELLEVLRQLDAYLLQAYIVPPRSLLEAKHGSKADSGTAVDALEEVAGDVAHQIADQINAQIIPAILEKNFGAWAKNGVKIQVPGDSADLGGAMRVLLEKITSSQPGIESLLLALDLDAMCDQAGVPLKKDASLSDAAEERVQYHQLQEEKAAENGAAIKTAGAGGALKPPKSGMQNSNSGRQPGGK